MNNISVKVIDKVPVFTNEDTGYAVALQYARYASNGSTYLGLICVDCGTEEDALIGEPYADVTVNLETSSKNLISFNGDYFKDDPFRKAIIDYLELEELGYSFQGYGCYNTYWIKDNVIETKLCPIEEFEEVYERIAHKNMEKHQNNLSEQSF